MGRFSNALAALRGAPIAKKRNHHFAAASHGRLLANFPGTRLSADESIKLSLRPMRNRSRALANNNPYVARFLNLLRVNVAGPKGLTLQSRALDALGAPDERDRALIELQFARQSERGNFETTGRLSRAAFERMLVVNWARDGEALYRYRPGHRDSATGYAVEMIDPDLLDEELNIERGDLRIRMGVEINKFGRPVAYWLLKQHPGDGLRQSYGVDGFPKDAHERVPAEEINHIFMPFRANQNRGVPLTHAVILNLNDLGQYRQSAVVAAKVGSDKVGFLAGEYLYGDDDDANDVIMPSEAGEFGQLPEGTELHEWDPNYPHEQFGAFNKAMLQGISAGVSIAYPTLANDLEGVNFSSIRAGTIDERDGYTVAQEFLKEAHATPCSATGWATN